MWRLTIEATAEKDEGGPMPPYEMRVAPTWALEEIAEAIRFELAARDRLLRLMREEELRRKKKAGG